MPCRPTARTAAGRGRRTPPRRTARMSRGEDSRGATIAAPLRVDALDYLRSPLIEPWCINPDKASTDQTTYPIGGRPAADVVRGPDGKLGTRAHVRAGAEGPVGDPPTPAPSIGGGGLGGWLLRPVMKVASAARGPKGRVREGRRALTPLGDADPVGAAGAHLQRGGDRRPSSPGVPARARGRSRTRCSTALPLPLCTGPAEGRPVLVGRPRDVPTVPPRTPSWNGLGRSGGLPESRLDRTSTGAPGGEASYADGVISLGPGDDTSRCRRSPWESVDTGSVSMLLSMRVERLRAARAVRSCVPLSCWWRAGPCPGGPPGPGSAPGCACGRAASRSPSGPPWPAHGPA